MKILVLLMIGLLDATYASKCKGECVRDGVLWEDFLAHEDCNKYCVCTKFKPLEYRCRQGLHFSLELQTCVDPSKANCRNTTDLPGSTPPPPTPPPSVDKNRCIGTCPSKNSDNFTVLLPNTNCSRYCMCNWGIAIPKDCPPGLVFNNDNQTCDYPFNVKCPNITHVNQHQYHSELLPIFFQNIEKIDRHEEKKKIKAGCRIQIEEDQAKGCLGKCPHSNSLDHTEHLPHKECEKFCKCNWGMPIVQNCPENLHFNNASKTCDFAFNANCTGIGKLEDQLK